MIVVLQSKVLTNTVITISMYFKLLNFFYCYFIYCLVYIVVDELTSAIENTAFKTIRNHGWIGDTSNFTL